MESVSDVTCANSFYLLFSLWNSKFPFVVFTASALNSQINLSSINVSTLAHCLIRQYTYGCSGELHCPMPRIHNTGLETFLLQVWIYSSWTHWIHLALQVFLQGTQALFFMAKTNAIISSGTIPGGTAVFWYSCMRAFKCRTISGCLRLKSCRSVGSADMLKRANSTMFVFWSWERKRERRSQKHVKDLCW